MSLLIHRARHRHGFAFVLCQGERMLQAGGRHNPVAEPLPEVIHGIVQPPLLIPFHLFAEQIRLHRHVIPPRD